MAPPRRRPNTKGQVQVNEKETKRNERAWRAVKAFNELAPTLTSFARAITGDKKMVVLAASRGGASSISGNTIRVQPPIALGDGRQHNRQLCEKRDRDTRMQRCEACAARELLMCRVFHEIAHSVFNSEDKILKSERKLIRGMIDEWHPADVCGHGSKLKTLADMADGHLDLANAFSPFLMGILRSIEDARVDSKMYRARPGLKVPNDVRYSHTFTHGTDFGNGVPVFWRDTPLNSQVIIGILLLAAGHKIRDNYLSAEAIEHLADEELISISGKALFANSVHNSLETTVELFRRLQEMKLCYVPKCVPTPSLNAEPEKGNDDDEAGDSGEGESEPSDGADGSDGKPDDGNRDDADGSSGDESGDEGDGDPADKSDDLADKGDGSGLSGEHQSEAGPGGDDDEPSEDESEPTKDRSSGDDSQDADDDAASDEADVPDAHDGKDGADDLEDDGDVDSGDADRKRDGGASSEPNAGDEDAEPEGVGEGDAEPLQEEPGDAGEPGGSDDAGSSGDVDESADREPGADAQGSGSDGSDPSGDVDPDAEAESEAGLGDGGEADGDLDEAEGDGDEPLAEARREVKGEDVWEEDNPELQGVNHGVENGVENEFDPAEYGSPDEVLEALEKFHGHGHEEEIDAELLGETLPTEAEAKKIVEAVATAVAQAMVFDCSSLNVRGVRVIKYPHTPFQWPSTYRYEDPITPAEFMPSEAIIGPALMQARLVFSENKRAKNIGNLRTGKINTSVLGRRAALGDDRLFKRKILPGKRDYFVVIGIDCSGSTGTGFRMERIKRAAFAKAELLNRLGIKFAIYGHTGGTSNADNPRDYESLDYMTEVWMLEIKNPDEAWNDGTKQRLAELEPQAENLDGHSLEFYRKIAEKRRETDRIIIYYTDGAMPAANHDEELVILLDEIDKCKKRDITLMAVGINTDSPTKYGFDTIRVDSDSDLSKVVAQLKRRLIG